MKFIHNRDKGCINILNANQQLILKIVGHPLLFCRQHSGWFLACGKETIQIDMNAHNNNEASLDIFYQKKHILSFREETPESLACLSIYDKLPSLMKVPELSDIQKNKWILMDYREQDDSLLYSGKLRIQKVKKIKLHTSRTINKKARFREL